MEYEVNIGMVTAIRNIEETLPGVFSLEVLHEKHGWIPYGVSTTEPVETELAEAVAQFLRDNPDIAAQPTEAERQAVIEQRMNSLRSSMVVTRLQAKVALMQAGLLEKADAAIAAAGPVAVLAWSEAPTFSRLSPTVASMASALNLTDEQVDDLFTAAMEVKL